MLSSSGIPTRLRWCASGAVLLAALLSTSACVPFIPIAANEKPLALTVRDGEIWFHWCGELTERFGFLSVDYALWTPDRRDESAAEGSGRFRLGPGTEFSVDTPPADLRFDVTSEIPITSDRMAVFVEAGQAPDNLGGLSVIFDSDQFNELEDGDSWLYPSGEISDEPCGMRAARN